MKSATNEKLNAMAGDRPICENLKRYYGLSRDKKQKYLDAPEAIRLFKGLPKEVSGILKESFLEGRIAKNVSEWNIVLDYFQNNSKIIPALTENPGTYTMLEKMYHFEKVSGVIDNYFLESIAGGQALRNRYDIVTGKACEHIEDILKTQDVCLMLDIGSGPGRNCIDICRKKPQLNHHITIDCIDINKDAIRLGRKLVKQYGIKQVQFVEESMTQLKDRYPHNVDYALLIGILCSLTYKEKVKLMRRLRKYFKPGARIVAAALTVEMAKKDLLCAYILREITGWGLQYPEFGQLKDAFIESGWTYEGVFQENPTKLYEICIGTA